MVFNADIKKLDGFIAFDFIKPNNKNDVDGYLFFLSKNGPNEPLSCPGIKLKNNNEEEIFKYSSPQMVNNSLLGNCTLRVVKVQQLVQLYLNEIKMLDFSANETKRVLPSKVKFRLRTNSSTRNYILLKNFCIYDLGNGENIRTLLTKEHKTGIHLPEAIKKANKDKSNTVPGSTIRNSGKQSEEKEKLFSKEGCWK